jgi:hypothetical protein
MDGLAFEERTLSNIHPGLDVCDKDGNKVGSVAHIHETGPATRNLDDGVYVEVKTGFLGLGKRLYIPFREVREITEGGVILSRSKAEINSLGWHTKPAGQGMEGPGAGDESVHPAGSPGDTVAAPMETASPAGAASATKSWEEVQSQYRTRWGERYGAQGANWARYEPRYRFAWEMRQHPDYHDRSWIAAQPDLRRAWEDRHPNEEWDQVSDTVRDAWEHPVEA